MKPNILPLSKPDISEKEINAVADILRSGWITTGHQCSEFETEFSRYCQSGQQKNYSIALSSATAGMHLLLKALGIGKGDEVITPSLTWVSTVNVITLAGATPIFADVDKESLMVTRETIAPCISERTRLILPVHFAGAALDLMPLYQLAAEHSIPLVEDAAHAVGTEYREQKIGSSGQSIFSFHPIKNITCGEGGMFCTENNELAQCMRRLRFHGLGVDAYDRHQQGRAPQAEVLEPGFKYNLTDIAACLGRGQLRRLEEFIAVRTKLAALYNTLIAEIDELQPLRPPEDFPYSMRHSWHLYIVRLMSKRINRDDFMLRLKEKNIGTGLHFRAVHQQKYYRQTMPHWLGRLPSTEWNSERICSLPLFPAMTEDDVYRVITAIKEILR